MRWDVVLERLPQLLEGALVSLQLVSVAVVVGLLLAVPIGVARASPRWWVKCVPYVYIFLFRGTPLLVQLFIVYYGLSQFDAVRDSVFWGGWRFNYDIPLPFAEQPWQLKWRIPGLRDAFMCALLTMTLHTAAYIAEIIRGAIQAVPEGEIEAGKAVGMSTFKCLQLIIMPRAVRIGLPAYSNEVILMLKASSLASTVTVMELTGVARTLSAKTYLQAEFFLAAGAIYLIISFVLIQGFRLLEYWLNADRRAA